MPTQPMPWSMLSDREMSREAIQALHQPDDHFRVSQNGYEAGAAFPGTSRAGRIYVLAGRCTWQFGEQLFDLTARTWVDLPGGEYQHRGIGEEPSRFVRVWELPDWLWKKPAAIPLLADGSN